MINVLVLFGAPVVLGALFWAVALLEPDADDAGDTPFDPPRWR